jgi:hypothetical protein
VEDNDRVVSRVRSSEGSALVVAMVVGYVSITREGVRVCCAVAVSCRAICFDELGGEEGSKVFVVGTVLSTDMMLCRNLLSHRGQNSSSYESQKDSDSCSWIEVCEGILDRSGGTHDKSDHESNCLSLRLELLVRHRRVLNWLESPI